MRRRSTCRRNSAASELGKLGHRCRILQGEVHEIIEQGSVARQTCLEEGRRVVQAMKRRYDEINRALGQSQALIAQWRDVGSRLYEECAQRLRFAGPQDESTEAQYHFNRLRDIFLRQHGSCILRHLRTVFPHLSLRLVEAPMAPEVQRRFLEVWKNGVGPSIDLRPAFHGTRLANMPSIFGRGLLIPGRGNSVKVAHGSAHGRGIYVAKVHAAHLSAGFARSCVEGMLVVGVLDDAVAPAVSHKLGSFSVEAESTSLRHVGDAMVVFDPSRVLPFFSVAICE